MVQVLHASVVLTELLAEYKGRMQAMENGRENAGEEKSHGGEGSSAALPEINEVALVGRLMNVPKAKDFGEDKNRAQFTIGVPRPSRSEDGKRLLDYVTVVAWRSLAKQCSELSKGDGVHIEGRIRTWQDKTKRSHWQVEADTLKVLDRQSAVEGKAAEPQQRELAEV